MRWVVFLQRCIAAGPGTRPSLGQRIESVRVRADSIRLDGRADDWVGKPCRNAPLVNLTLFETCFPVRSRSGG